MSDQTGDIPQRHMYLEIPITREQIESDLDGGEIIDRMFAEAIEGCRAEIRRIEALTEKPCSDEHS